MAVHDKSNVRLISASIKSELILRVGLEPEQIVFSVTEAEQVPHYSAEREVVIQILNEISMESAANYGVRTDPRRMRTFRFACRTRMLLDVDGQDDVILLDEENGHIALEDRVADAMIGFQGEDEDGNVFGAPLRMGTLTQPRRESGGNGWIYSVMTFDCEYSRDVDQSRR